MSADKFPTAQPIDAFARDLPESVRQSVYHASKLKTEKRVDVLWRDYPDPNANRQLAGEIKQHTLEHLDSYLVAAEARLKANGATVHWAADADACNRIIGGILESNNCSLVVKSKSMVTEEIELVPYLAQRGIEAIETDLGEYIVQIDGDHPSHIVTPIIHKNRGDIARSFEREGLGSYNDDPEVITMRARNFLRGKYLQAHAGITGANFVSAESGRIVLVTNEGNSRFCMAAPRIHIAVVGIEKIVPRDRDLGLFLSLLARSATAQCLSVYTEFINGPRRAGQENGPEQMHVVFLDNRRTEVLASNCREILRCIRCGACLNVCPVYRQASGHGYREVYSGPVGAVLSPLLHGDRFPELADLPKASSLCGACNEVCPVNIPIPTLLLKLRDKAKRDGTPAAAAGTPSMGPWSVLASSPTAWTVALKAGRMMNIIPQSFLRLHPAARAWTDSRDLPPFRGGEFRKWLQRRKRGGDHQQKEQR